MKAIVNLIEKIRIKKKIHKLYEQIILCRDIETEKELSLMIRDELMKLHKEKEVLYRSVPR